MCVHMRVCACACVCPILRVLETGVLGKSPTLEVPEKNKSHTELQGLPDSQHKAEKQELRSHSGQNSVTWAYRLSFRPVGQKQMVLERNLHICAQLIPDEVAESVQQGKNSILA